MDDIEIFKSWKLNYFRCDRFEQFRLNWDNNAEQFTTVDAMGIGHWILMMPGRALLKVLDMLQPVAKYFKIDCSWGLSTEWILASALLWALIFAIVVQFYGFKRVRKG